MKHLQRSVKTLCLALALLLSLSAMFCFSSCSSKKPVIGIIQFGSHGSLNNCYDGIMQGLKDSGLDLDAYDIQYVNSNFDYATSLTQANKMLNEGAKVIIAIATPSAVAAANAASGTVPVVFCAITDSTTMANYKGLTGSSDIPNFAKQLELVTAMMGKTDLKIGVLSSTEESSSPFQVSELQKAASAYSGMTIESSVVADIATIDTAVNGLLSKGVDCFINLLDNTIVGKLESNILPLTNAAGIPVFGSEIEQVKVGCAGSASIDYIVVGKSAGEAAAQILNGTPADDIPVAVIKEPTNYYNSEVCARFQLTVPASLNAIDVKAQ